MGIEINIIEDNAGGIPQHTTIDATQGNRPVGRYMLSFSQETPYRSFGEMKVDEDPVWMIGRMYIYGQPDKKMTMTNRLVTELAKYLTGVSQRLNRPVVHAELPDTHEDGHGLPEVLIDRGYEVAGEIYYIEVNPRLSRLDALRERFPSLPFRIPRRSQRPDSLESSL